MTPQPQQPNPNELLLITREELERCCSQMSAAGYKVSANYVEASVLSRPAPSPDPRVAFFEEDNAYKDSIIEQQRIHINTLNVKMSEMMQGAAAQAREDVLDIFDEFLNSDDHLTLYKWEVREKIRTLRRRTWGYRR